jgi:hypothetical protein
MSVANLIWCGVVLEIAAFVAAHSPALSLLPRVIAP